MWSARWLTYQTEMFIDTSGDSNFLPNVTAHWLTQQRDGRYILFCCEDSAEYGHRADIELKNLTSSSAQYPESRTCGRTSSFVSLPTLPSFLPASAMTPTRRRIRKYLIL